MNAIVMVDDHLVRHKILVQCFFHILAVLVGLYISSGMPVAVRIVEVSLALALTAISQNLGLRASTTRNNVPEPLTGPRQEIAGPAVLLSLLNHLDRNLLTAALTLDDLHRGAESTVRAQGQQDLVA